MSSKVSGGLGKAIKEAQAKMNGETVTEPVVTIDEPVDIGQLLDSGVEAHQKRKGKGKKSKAKEEPIQPDFEEESRPKTHEEFCERELEKARERNLPEPDFDFRNFYEKGQIVFFVRVLSKLGIKEVKKLYLRSIYPRMMVGSEDKAGCHCIGYNERDQVFLTPRDADAYFKTVEVSSEYAEEPKSGRKGRKGAVDDPEDENAEFEPYTSSEDIPEEEE